MEIVDGSLTGKEVCELEGENRIKLLIFESRCVSASGNAPINVDVNSYTGAFVRKKSIRNGFSLSNVILFCSTKAFS